MRTSKSTHMGSGARNAEEEQFPVVPLGGDVGHGAAARWPQRACRRRRPEEPCEKLRKGREVRRGFGAGRSGALGLSCWERRLSVGERQRRASGPARKTASYERPAVAERDSERETERRLPLAAARLQAQAPRRAVRAAEEGKGREGKGREGKCGGALEPGARGLWG